MNGKCGMRMNIEGSKNSRYCKINRLRWLLVPKFAGSSPAEAVGFLGRKNPQHAFLRRGSKAVGPMS